MNKKTIINDLKKAIFNLHNTKAKWKESVQVIEKFQGSVVWNGQVEIFDLIDHPTAKSCYAWDHVIDGSTKRKYIVVLHQPPIDSPQAAVRAAIIQEYRGRQGG